MNFMLVTVAETQKNSLAAAVDFTDSWLSVVERLTRLHLEVSRAVVEKSSEVTLLCLQSRLAENHAGAWQTGVESGIERFVRYCQAVNAMAQAAAPQ